MTAETKIPVYGADWCPDCRMVKMYLDQHDITYDYIDIEEGNNLDAMLEITNGSKIIPALIIYGKLYQEPSLVELKEALAG